MKRIPVILLTMIFALGAVFSAPLSFAEEWYGENAPSESGEFSEFDESKAMEETLPNVKDTSWFDYQNPKKSYEISTEAELMGLASLINEEQVDRWKPTRIENFEDVTFTLTKDIKLTQDWKPIGTGTASHFSGIFDGGGHTVSGLKVSGSFDVSGLFGYLTGEVRDLTVKGKIDSKSDRCGGIAGHISETAKISNCNSDVKITAKDKTGGIAGYNEHGTITKCTNFGRISGTYKVGGIVGENWGGTVSKSKNLGEIVSSKRGFETYGTGGVAGRSLSSSAKISESCNLGLIISATEATGGVVGYTNAGNSSVKNCYNTGNIQIINKKGSLIKSNAGGIAGTVGMRGVKITNCYSIGQIKNADVYGGIIGKYLNESELKGTFIKNNYYTHDSAGAAIGECEDPAAGEISDLGKSVSGNGLISMAGTLGTAYMRDSSNLYGNNGYPVLRWQKPMTHEEKAYISNIPKELQIKLDRYLIKKLNKNTYGQSMIDFFNPEGFISDSIVMYMQAQEKAETKKIK